ncbi:MAG: PASTA domain-containing protein [Planctomycetota bacterium]|nr:PASTA domain-containing protein [Planctomycetota bacterium]
MTRWTLRRALLALLTIFLLACPVDAEGERITVPDVRRRRADDARQVMEAAGFKVGEVYEFSLARILTTWRVRGVVGTVFLQKPEPGTMWPKGHAVDLVVVAERDGKLPPEFQRPAQPTAPAPRDPVPPPTEPSREDRPAPDAPKVAEGSPDAPRPAPKPDRNRVPDMLGLELAEAEHLARQSEMSLHVERVAGHPIGRVLEQVPVGGAPRPPGGMLKVVITAGGDFESRMPGPPAVHVDAIGLPDLLDRTRLQAERIVEALGLRVEFKDAERGLPGRVVDQKPAAGAEVPKGSFVTLWIGPGSAEGEAPVAPPGPTDVPDKPKDPAPEAPLDPGPLPRGVPEPVSPSTNTPIPPGESVPVGFTWRGVDGANAYLLEVEEMGAEGRWLPLARKPARTTAVLMDVERIDARGTSQLRWRVTAVIGGRRGTPSDWIVLK